MKRKAMLKKAERIVTDYGVGAIILGRLVTAVRSVVPVLVGVSGMSPLRFTIADLIACTIWTTGLGLLVTGINNAFS